MVISFYPQELLGIFYLNQYLQNSAAALKDILKAKKSIPGKSGNGHHFIIIQITTKL